MFGDWVVVFGRCEKKKNSCMLLRRDIQFVPDLKANVNCTIISLLLHQMYICFSLSINYFIYAYYMYIIFARGIGFRQFYNLTSAVKKEKKMMFEYFRSFLMFLINITFRIYKSL